jgi:hypothetical protein
VEVSLPVTVISLPPSWVWLRRRAVRAAVSFSKVTVADLVVPSVVMSMVEILPLGGVSGWMIERRKGSSPEAEEVLNLLVLGLGANVLDVNCGRHVDGCKGVAG